MKNLIFDYKNSLINIKELSKYSEKIISTISKIRDDFQKSYNTVYASLYLPHDPDLIIEVKNKAKKFKQIEPSMIILIGIGGSNLGSLAVFNALKGIYYNQKNPSISFYCADTIADDYIGSLLELAESELEKGNHIVLIIVSKSGTTTETIVNASCFIELLKRYKSDYQKYIMAITDKDSALWYVAIQNNYDFLEIPKLVGGRFSIFSAAGLFPLEMIGIDIDELKSGAYDIQKISLNEDISENYSALSALIIYEHFRSGKNMSDLFIFSPDLALLGSWYRQLVAESLGKKHDLNDNEIEIGITPIVSIGTTDLHSMTQLYLGGPRDKITTFVSILRESEVISIQENNISNILPVLINKTITGVKQTILEGVKLAYEKEERPFMSIILPEKNAYFLGQFMMMKIIETIYLGSLLNINAFDQPAVELYKEETRRILSHA